MYIPPDFKLDDPDAIAELLAAHDFGLLVTGGAAGPEATHLPFLYDPERRLVEGHLSRGNGQWRTLERLAGEGGQALLIVQGPHSYVSPRWYAQRGSVPTWNYLALHLYGTPRPIAERDRLFAQQERLARRYEDPAGWSMASVPPEAMERLLRGIYGFELPVARLEAKAKLSQNKTAGDRAGVVAELEAADHPDARATAAWMRRLTEMG